MNVYGPKALRALYKAALKESSPVTTECTLDGYYKVYSIERKLVLGTLSDEQEEWMMALGYLRPQ